MNSINDNTNACLVLLTWKVFMKMQWPIFHVITAQDEKENIKLVKRLWNFFIAKYTPCSGSELIFFSRSSTCYKNTDPPHGHRATSIISSRKWSDIISCSPFKAVETQLYLIPMQTQANHYYYTITVLFQLIVLFYKVLHNRPLKILPFVHLDRLTSLF